MDEPRTGELAALERLAKAANESVHPVNWSYWIDHVLEKSPSRAMLAAVSPDVVLSLIEQARAASRPAVGEEGLNVERLAGALVMAVRSEGALIGYQGDGWPAYWEKDRPATVLNVDILASAIVREYAALAAADEPDEP